ncbi:MAG: DNA methylase, partial [Oscillospiraceae bacterium]
YFVQLRIAKVKTTAFARTTSDNLGNIDNYEEFLDILVNKEVFLQCARTLKYGQYMALVVSDFRDKSEYISFHSDLVPETEQGNYSEGGVLRLQGTKILLQNHKSLLPYGYPLPT